MRAVLPPSRRGRLRLPGTEDAIQANIVTYLRVVLPRKHYRVFAVPNGGKRGQVEAARMRATGTLAGVPDLCIVGPGGATWWLEVKTASGRLTPEQKNHAAWMAVAEVPHGVVRSIDDAALALQGWGLRTREVA